MDHPLSRYYIRTGVLDALSRHGIAHDSPLRAQLEANATIAASNNSVIMKNGNSLDAEIENARSSPPAAAESLPTGSRTVAKSDTDSLRKNFTDIAAGKVQVTN